MRSERWKRSTSNCQFSTEPTMYLVHISKDEGVYWRSNMLCIKQGAPCSDPYKCPSSVRLNIWQRWDPGWLPSDSIQHPPVPLTTAGLRGLRPPWTPRTSTPSKQLCPSLPENTHDPLSEGTTSRINLSAFSSSLYRYSQYSLVASKRVIPNCPGKWPQNCRDAEYSQLYYTACFRHTVMWAFRWCISTDPIAQDGTWKQQCSLSHTGWGPQSRMSYGNI